MKTYVLDIEEHRGELIVFMTIFKKMAEIIKI